MDDKEFSQALQDKLAPATDTEEVEEQSAPKEGTPMENESEGLILGKYKSQADLAAAHEELQRKLGEQGAELGELRRVVEMQQPQSAPLTEGTVTWFDEVAEENPQQAIQWAMQNDPSGILYNRALEVWYETNPRQASAFERSIEMAAMEQNFSQQLSQQTQPILQSAIQVAQDQAVYDFEQAHPDYEEMKAEMAQIAAMPESRPIVETSASSPEALKSALDYFYLKAKANRLQKTEALSQAEGQALQAANAKAEEAKQRSQVASASSNGGALTEESPVDRFKKAILSDPLGQR